MTLDTPTRTESHRVDHDGSDVIVRDVEHFIEYDETFDGSRNKALTSEYVAQVYEGTQARITAGSSPRIVVGHDFKNERPAVGKLENFRLGKVRGKSAIISDVRMSREDFEFYLASNRYPRRSAEIVNDKYIAQVALLGSSAPGRPLPDTHFSSDDEAQVFECQATVATFAAVAEPETHEVTEMPDDQLNEQIEAKDARIAELEAELAKRDEQTESFSTQISELKTWAEEGFAKRDEEAIRNKIEVFKRDGYGVPDGDRLKQIIDRCVKADDPAAELTFYAEMWPKPGEATEVDTSGATVPGTDAESVDAHSDHEKKRAWAVQARKRCEAKGEFTPAAFSAALADIEQEQAEQAA